MLRAVVAAALTLAAPAASPATVASVPQQLIGVTQEGVAQGGVAQRGGSIAWLTWSAGGCGLSLRSAAGATLVTKAPNCGLIPHDLALAGTTAAWGGYEDVRCSETDATVHVAGRLIANIPGDCRGFGTAYAGLAGDGTSFYYSLLTTREPPPTSNCGDGGACKWQLTGGVIVRVDANGKKATLSGLPPAALIAGAPGRLALAEAAGSARSNGQTFDWPRAAAGGKVDIYDTSGGRVVTSFSPGGTVRAVALSPDTAAVVVQNGAAFHLAWYDAASGAKRGSVAVPASSAPLLLATDGKVAAYSAGNTVRVVDLTSHASTLVAHTTGPPVGLSIAGGRLTWGENTPKRGRVRAVAVA